MQIEYLLPICQANQAANTLQMSFMPILVRNCILTVYVSGSQSGDKLPPGGNMRFFGV